MTRYAPYVGIAGQLVTAEMLNVDYDGAYATDTDRRVTYSHLTQQRIAAEPGRHSPRDSPCTRAYLTSYASYQAAVYIYRNPGNGYPGWSDLHECVIPKIADSAFGAFNPPDIYAEAWEVVAAMFPLVSAVAVLLWESDGELVTPGTVKAVIREHFSSVDTRCGQS